MRNPAPISTSGYGQTVNRLTVWIGSLNGHSSGSGLNDRLVSLQSLRLRGRIVQVEMGLP